MRAVKASWWKLEKDLWCLTHSPAPPRAQHPAGRAEASLRQVQVTAEQKTGPQVVLVISRGDDKSNTKQQRYSSRKGAVSLSEPGGPTVLVVLRDDAKWKVTIHTGCYSVCSTPSRNYSVIITVCVWRARRKSGNLRMWFTKLTCNLQLEIWMWLQVAG